MGNLYGVLAQIEPPDAPWLTLVNYGVLGVLVILFVWNKIHSEGELRRVERAAEQRVADALARADSAESRAAEAELRLSAERATIEGKFIPAWVRSTDALNRVLDRSLRSLGGDVDG